MKVVFRFSIDSYKYAKRFGIVIADDRLDIIPLDATASEIKPVESAAQNALEVAMDAAVDWQSDKVKAKFDECQAQNPILCRYHGMQGIATEIEQIFKSEGLNGKVSVNVVDVPSDGVVALEASVDGVTEDDEPAVKKALEKFFALPGVDGDIDYAFVDEDEKKGMAGFEVDLLNKGAISHFAPEGQQPSATTAPSTAPSPAVAPANVQPSAAQSPAKIAPPRRLRRGQGKTTAPKAEPQKGSALPSAAQQIPSRTPSAASAEPMTDELYVPLAENDDKLFPEAAPPPKPTINPSPFTDEELDFLEKTSEDVNKMAWKANNRIESGKVNKLAGSSTLTRFKGIDRNRLSGLAAKDTTGRVNAILSVMGEIDASESSGWANRILPTKWNPSGRCRIDGGGYYGKKGDLDFSDVSFSRRLYGVASQPEQAAKSKDHVSEASAEAETALLAAGSGFAIDGAKELGDAVAEANSVKDGFDYAKSVKDDIGENAFKSLWNSLGAAYRKSVDSVRSAAQKCSRSFKEKFVQHGTVAETIDSMKAKHLAIPDAMKNWAAVESQYEDRAWRRVASHFGFNPSDKSKHMAIFKKNMAAAAMKCTTFTLVSTDCVNSLLDGSYDAIHANDNSYVDAYNAVFDQNKIKLQSRRHMVVYASTFDGQPKDMDRWYDRRTHNSQTGRLSGPRCAVAVHNDKVVKGLTNGCCSTRNKLQHHTDDTNVSPMTDCSCTAVTYDLGNISKKAFTEDLSALPPDKLWQSIGIQKVLAPRKTNDRQWRNSKTSSNETWLIEGVRLDQISHIKYFDAPPRFTKQRVAQLKKHGIRILNGQGNDITANYYT